MQSMLGTVLATLRSSAPGLEVLRLTVEDVDWDVQLVLPFTGLRSLDLWALKALRYGHLALPRCIPAPAHPSSAHHYLWRGSSHPRRLCAPGAPLAVWTSKGYASCARNHRTIAASPPLAMERARLPTNRTSNEPLIALFWVPRASAVHAP
ncbi:hypothetical protein C8Q72DRAFT_824662 [Fomitopsis betulina]|nr:hypothetical protein C8Q72DRAFT_824662 [Fomitopsis betulina]